MLRSIGGFNPWGAQVGRPRHIGGPLFSTPPHPQPFQHSARRPCALMPRLAYALAMRYVLGFDGGGTKTECVLMDESRHVLARSRSGPSNPMRVGFGGALAAVCEAAR